MTRAKSVFPIKKSGGVKYEEIILSDNVEVFSEGLFELHAEISSPLFTSSLKKILEKAYYSNKGIKQLKISNTIEFIGSSAFAFSSSLEEIFIDSE